MPDQGFRSGVRGLDALGGIGRADEAVDGGGPEQSGSARAVAAGIVRSSRAPSSHLSCGPPTAGLRAAVLPTPLGAAQSVVRVVVRRPEATVRRARTRRRVRALMGASEGQGGPLAPYALPQWAGHRHTERRRTGRARDCGRARYRTSADAQTVAELAVRVRFCAGTSGATEERVRAGVGAGVADAARAMTRFAAVRAAERVLVVRFGLATDRRPASRDGCSRSSRRA